MSDETRNEMQDEDERVKGHMLGLVHAGEAQRTLDVMQEEGIALASEPMRDGAVLMIINDDTVLRVVQYALSLMAREEGTDGQNEA